MNSVRAVRAIQAEPIGEDDDDYEPEAPVQPVSPRVPATRSGPRRRSHAQIYVCTRLAGDQDAGRLLSWLVSWSRKATGKRGLPGKWNANARDAILRGTGLTWKRYRRAREILIERDLTEFRLHFFGGRKMIFTRPGMALMPHFGGAVTHCRGDESHDTGHDSGHDTGHDLTPSTLPSSHHSNQGLQQRGPGEGRGGQPTREAAPPPSPHASASPPVLSLVRRQTRAELRREEDAATAALTPRVQAALAREHLNTDALRAALLSAMPVISGLHTVRHPSGMYGDRWHQFSSEVLARTYVGYEACVARSLAKLGIRRSVGPAGYLSTDRDRELAADLSLPDEELPIMALNERRIARALATPPRAWEDLPDPHAD